jgi:hypothetical protein
MLDQAALEEAPQDAFDHRAERPMAGGNAFRVGPQELLQMPLDEAEQR